jgi:hypothetical protein
MSVLQLLLIEKVDYKALICIRYDRVTLKSDLQGYGIFEFFETTQYSYNRSEK